MTHIFLTIIVEVYRLHLYYNPIVRNKSRGIIQMDCFASFPERLKKSIDDSKCTQKEIADAIGISSHAFTKYLNGRIPKPDILYRISKYFNKSMEWFLTGENSTFGLCTEIKKADVIFDSDLKMMIDIITNLMTSNDEHVRSWTIVQFNKAFTDELHSYELEKKHNA